MRTAPQFWWRHHPSLAATLLRPLGVIYGAVTARRMAQSGTLLPAPVLCVGNFVAGGAGKTPTAVALGTMLIEAGHRPAFLSRGYGRQTSRVQLQAVLRVDVSRHGAAEVGDEPLLLAQVAPTYVSTDRVAAGHQAIANGASVLVLDDGLQNPTLRKTISLAVIDGSNGVGNGLCVPAGPLRAPLASQWPHVAAVCLIGDGESGARVARQTERPVFRARLVPDPATVGSLRGTPLYAFAGIGQPAKFFKTLEDSDLDLRGCQGFPDHHRFSDADLARLTNRAALEGARLITTSKDRMRLPAGFPALDLPVSLAFDDIDALRQLVVEAIR